MLRPTTESKQTMERARRNGEAFAIPQLWQSSRWLSDAPEPPSQFFSPTIDDITALERSPKQSLQEPSSSEEAPTSGQTLLELTRVGADRLGFFRVLSLEYLDPMQQSDVGVSRIRREEYTTTPEDENDGESDLWMGHITEERNTPQYKTWDGFLSGEHSTIQPLYLSEAGPSAYDALLSWDTDPLELKNMQVPIVETRTYLASLLALAAGRESIFFAKSPGSPMFKPSLPRARLSGYSFDSLKGLENRCMSCGCIFLKLRAFVQTSYRKQPGRCTIALSSALNRILHILQQELDIEARDPRSLLHLQSTINKVSNILQPLNELVLLALQGTADEKVLSVVFKHACVVEHKETFVREIMQEILRVVSLPWLELLEEWIGTKAEKGVPFTTANIGEAKGFVKVESETCIDDFGEEFEEVDYRLDADRLPDFFPMDIAQLAFDAGKNLRFIRTSSTTHPLITAQGPNSSRPFDAPKAEWAFGWMEVLRLEKKVTRYQNNLRAAISGTISRGSTCHASLLDSDEKPDKATPLFGSNEVQIEKMILTSMEQFRAPLSEQEHNDPFVTILQHNLRRHASSPKKHSSIAAPHPSLLPVLSFGAIVSSQAEVVNRECLKLLFNVHHLRDHLNLQRSFHLLGSGMFCSRLSHALFDPDLETAERHAGVARQGGVMGLRLGSRDTWPPASSELRLALMGILTESFNLEHGTSSVPFDSSLKKDALPGDLSFAVRDLPPEAIEKCMDPDSLEALDFLRLAYTTPKELRVVITPVMLMRYDRIFKFLVRLLRMMFVVDELFRVVNLRTSAWHEPGNIAHRFSREARHFVSSIAAYFLDTGIAVPWQAFQAKMDQMQDDLAQDHLGASEMACSPEVLGDYHSQAINHMLSALFLRKRQQPILTILEDIFATVLTYAKHARLQALGSVVEGDHTRAYSKQLYQDFKKKLQVFITVCRSLTEKTKSGPRSRDGSNPSADGLGDESVVSQLLLKLDVYHYYTKA